MVAEYTYFTSVKYEKALEDMGLGLVRVIREAALHYTLAHTLRKEFTRRGDCCGLVYEAVD